MGRILGIDYGLKRTGLAVTDPLKIIAGGLETVATEELENWLERYLARETVERIVVGCPTMLNGSKSETLTRYVLPFVNKLKNKFPDTIIDTFDERFTSKMAVDAMLCGGIKKKERRDKSKIDKLSATILLQGYLEKLKNEMIRKHNIF